MTLQNRIDTGMSPGAKAPRQIKDSLQRADCSNEQRNWACRFSAAAGLSRRSRESGRRLNCPCGTRPFWFQSRLASQQAYSFADSSSQTPSASSGPDRSARRQVAEGNLPVGLAAGFRCGGVHRPESARARSSARNIAARWSHRRCVCKRIRQQALIALRLFAFACQISGSLAHSPCASFAKTGSSTVSPTNNLNPILANI